jgi:hypothetical protein
MKKPMLNMMAARARFMVDMMLTPMQVLSSTHSVPVAMPHAPDKLPSAPRACLGS